MDWLSQSFEHEAAKWEVTGLDSGLWIREDVNTGFIITMAWLAQWLDNCDSYFQKSWFWTPSSHTLQKWLKCQGTVMIDHSFLFFKV